MSANTGGPAFPAPDADEEHFNQRSAYMGMNLRDYFAAKAVPGIMTMISTGTHHLQGSDNESPEQKLARHAYWLADAMLAERNKQ